MQIARSSAARSAFLARATVFLTSQGGALRASPTWLVKKTVARAKKADRAALERAICIFADLEIDMRGGGELQLDEDTAFSLALARAAA